MAQLGSAPEWGSGGRRFKSSHPDNVLLNFMFNLKEHFVIDKTGNTTAVLLDFQEYKKLMEALEEIESIKAYDTAKALNEEIISFEQAIEEIERQRLCLTS